MRMAHSLSQWLKHETREAHQRTEATPLLTDMFKDPFSHARYRTLLTRFYGWYRPIDHQLTQFIDQHRLPHAYQPRSPLLAMDLNALKVTPDSIVDHPVPDIHDYASFLGMLYVVEGSALGGTIIRKHLSQHMDVDHTARFFRPYEGAIKPRWDATCQWMDREATQQNIRPSDATRTAIATFQSIQEALHEQSPT